MGYSIHVERCIGCGSCAILAPGVFVLSERSRRVQILRQPHDPAEQQGCDVAALVCPTSAIARG